MQFYKLTALHFITCHFIILFAKKKKALSSLIIKKNNKPVKRKDEYNIWMNINEY